MEMIMFSADRPGNLCTFVWTLVVVRTKHIFRPLSFKTRFLQVYLTRLIRIGTPKFRRFILDLIPWKNVHEIRDIANVIQNTAVNIISSKKRAFDDGDEAVARQIGQGKDIISILSGGFLIPRVRMDLMSDH